MKISEEDVAGNLEDPQPVENGSGKTMTLMGGIAHLDRLPESDLDLESLKPGSKLFNQGTLLIVVVAAVAAACLSTMRLSQGELISNAATKQFEAVVDTALAKLNNKESLAADDPLQHNNLSSLFQDPDEIVAVFSVDVIQQQVPIEFVQKNPFVLPKSRVVSKPTRPNTPKTIDSRTAQRSKLERELHGLQLQSVVGGPNPVAIINRKLIQVNQAVGRFKVVAIRDRGVELVAGGHKFTLRMDRRRP